uniref:thioredoxin-dependent peroxiredoxin n=1 Tax=Latimeria chalumnae TaxID=7897 RepID=H3B2U4_LATCH
KLSKSGTSRKVNVYMHSKLWMVCRLHLQCDHYFRTNTPRKTGGLGPMKIPLVADTKRTISQDYGVLKEDEGIAYRGLFIIDDKGILRQITINDLPVGRSVDETLRLVQAFQFTDKHGEGKWVRGLIF